jgi:hypothetical protein
MLTTAVYRYLRWRRPTLHVLVVRVSFAASQRHYKGFVQIRFLSSPGRPGDPTLLTFCNSC